MRAVLLSTVLGVLALLTACGGGPTSNGGDNPSLLAIQVTGQNSTLIAGAGEQLTATGGFSNQTQQNLTSSVTWGTSNSAIATVSSNGMLNAVAAGNCTISASKGGVSGSFQLTVQPALTSISITPVNPTIAAKTSLQFTATGTFSDGSKKIITATVNWSSSNIAAATIGNSAGTTGLALGVAGGQTTITASSGAISNSTTLTVTSATATSIGIMPGNNPSLDLGIALQFTASATFSDGSQQDVTGVVTWSSSNSSVASITGGGLATGKDVGSTTISAAFEGVNAGTLLSVTAANLQSISIQGDSSAPSGITVFFTAIGEFNDGSTRNITQLVNWSSSNNSVISLGLNNGQGVTATPGAVTITATLGAALGNAGFTVTNAKIASISITPAVVTIPIGGHSHFTATGVFNDQSTADITSSATWTSNNTAVATVGSSSGSFGTAVGVSTGNASIQASFTANGATATGNTELTVDSGTLTSIALNPSSTLVAAGSSVQYNAIGNFSDNTSETINQFVTWSSSNTSAATVSQVGSATGQSSGVATITAQSGNIAGQATLVVESSPLHLIQIAPDNATDPVGIQFQFKAVGLFDNGDQQDLTLAATWTSSNPNFATISNSSNSSGVATGVAPGQTTISAAFAGQVGTATLTVDTATLTSIAVTPASDSIPLGQAVQLTATGTFSDRSQINITNQAAWSSSDPEFVTVNQFGVASSVASGTSTIKASLNNVSGTATVTVQ